MNLVECIKIFTSDIKHLSNHKSTCILGSPGKRLIKVKRLKCESGIIDVDDVWMAFAGIINI